MKLSDIQRMIDISAVRTDVTEQEIDELVAAAKRYHFLCAFAMPCYTRMLVEKLADTPDVLVGGVVGFPSGADTTEIKVFTAKQMCKAGAQELDMVINVGALKSGNDRAVLDDIKAVIAAGDGRPVKSILEIAYLTDDEIKRGAEIAVQAGVAYVKTGTGWAGKPTTVETIRLIKQTIGDAAKIKAAGGVRDLRTIFEMTEAGCSRFGIGIRSAIRIMEEAAALGAGTLAFEKVMRPQANA